MTGNSSNDTDTSNKSSQNTNNSGTGNDSNTSIPTYSSQDGISNNIGDNDLMIWVVVTIITIITGGLIIFCCWRCFLAKKNNSIPFKNSSFGEYNEMKSLNNTKKKQKPWFPLLLFEFLCVFNIENVAYVKFYK